MYKKVNNKKTELDLLNKAILFTGNHIIYGEAMKKAIVLWKHSMLNFLTNKSINRKAYLGHCAVFVEKQIPEYIVRMAWKSLTNKQRELANLEAEKYIKEWEMHYMKKSIITLKLGKTGVTQKEYQMRFPLK
tara:strand:+ start:3682 stop:4077 length:396 start_codon:yes stop_codon:yes gene_type:complete